MNTLIVVTGPTASGKTSLAIELASRLGCDIISADSRQIYKGLPIGTAAPTPDELARVRHHFVGVLDLDAYYSAACFENDVMKLLPSMWERGDKVVMCGGSMMYVDAVTRGIDELPTISPGVRSHVLRLYEAGGLEALHSTLRLIDPDYLAGADMSNHRRLIHAIEITMEASQPYSSLRTGCVANRPFKVVKMMIDHDRDTLFARINRRVDAMIDQGLVDEARSVYSLRGLNSLNTVGYKEMFAYFDGTMSLDKAVARIGKNTRVYAKKQLTWLKRDSDVVRLQPDKALEQALALID